ncbi:MAG: MBL fold metallo-hydrolase, partial [Ktedonobacterales bacterium]
PLSIEPVDVSRFAAYRDALINDTLTLADLGTREGLTLATDELLHWAHWITPLAFPKRFDTHFFLTEMPAGQEAAHDQLETTAGTWISPEEALARYEAGNFTLVFATIHQLRALSGLASVAAARKRFSGAPPRTIMPRVVERDGEQVILLPDED